MHSRRYTFCRVRYGELWCFSHWTSRQRLTTAGNSYYFIHLISKSAFVDAHQWIKTRINRRVREKNKKTEAEERERCILLPIRKYQVRSPARFQKYRAATYRRISQKYFAVFSIGSTFLLQIIISLKAYQYSDAHKMNL